MWETLLLANDSEKSSLLNDTVNIIFYSYGCFSVTAICSAVYTDCSSGPLSPYTVLWNVTCVKGHWPGRAPDAGRLRVLCAWAEIDPAEYTYNIYIFFLGKKNNVEDNYTYIY